MNGNSLLEMVEDQKTAIKNLERIMRSFDLSSNDDKTRGYVESVLEEMQTGCNKIKDNHDQLCDFVRQSSLREADVPYLQEDRFYKFQDWFLKSKGRLLDFLNNSNSFGSNALHSTAFVTSSHNRTETARADVRLPMIDLPTFNGDYLNWVSFRDMFVSMVHSNQSLTNIQKYFFLKNACTNTPLEIINEYPASDDNYDAVWSALNSRYHNKRKIVDSLLTKLFSIEKASGSCEDIKRIFDTTRNTLAQLKNLQVNTDSWDPLLIHLTVSKFDPQTHREWEQSLKGSTEIPRVSQLFDFLETTFRTLESLLEHKNLNLSVKGDDTKKIKPQNTNKNSRYSHNATATADDNCPCCKKHHLLIKCFKFSALPRKDRRNIVQMNGICRNCMLRGHFAKDCRLKSRCQICNDLHHTVLHQEFYTVPAKDAEDCEDAPDAQEAAAQDLDAQNVAAMNASTLPALTEAPLEEKGVEYPLLDNVCQVNALNSSVLRHVLLPSILVKCCVDNHEIFFRALLDQGSQASMISENAVQLLKLKRFKTAVNISGVGDSTNSVARKYTYIDLYSSFEKNFKLTCSALILQKLSQYRPPKVTSGSLPDLSEFHLADPDYLNDRKIDMILGADIYAQIILPEQKCLPQGIILQLTHFGWIVSGPMDQMEQRPIISVNICSIDDQLRAFWEQEEILTEKPIATEDKLCEDFFLRTCQRDRSGRYTVALPLKGLLLNDELPEFRYTDFSALRRLKQLEAKFLNDKSYEDQYKKFMCEYETLGHMKKVGSYPNDIEPNSYFLPHHGVLREDSSTTKLRVVFDGSSKTQAHNSLNEELFAGPALQNDLPAILTRWRRFKVVFRSDIEKMFRQIKVSDEHQKYQQILWRPNSSDEIGIYKLATVTYGTAAAPYLSIRVLLKLAEDEKQKFPEACKILCADTYVDDVISGADSEYEAAMLQKQLCELLSAGGFNLRKWVCNSETVMSQIPIEYREASHTVELQDNSTTKALGLHWNIKSDCFYFQLKQPKTNNVTKRSLLSDAFKLYDPLGWLSPATINAKIMFQKLWLLKLDWSDELPKELQEEWHRYQDGLRAIEEISIPRWFGSSQRSKIELHGFSDASSTAYAAVVYIKILNGPAGGSVKLLQAKTKVAPLKVVSIPRLELCAALLLVKLIEKISNGYKLNMEIANILFWTDSRVVLSWIQSTPSKLEVYIGNRVAEIQKFSCSTSSWRYVPTKHNPADCASRGISGSQLRDHKLWWTGPDWLVKDQDCWPKQPPMKTETNIGIRKASLSAHIAASQEIKYPEILFAYSSLTKLKRVVAYIYRFHFNSSYRLNVNIGDKEDGFLKAYELKEALLKLVKLSQEAEFAEDIRQLKKFQRVQPTSKLASLSPFIDESGIVRVGGRIKLSNQPYNFKHPIVLSKSNPLSLLLFKEAHAMTLHGGLQLMQSFVGKNFWIISSRTIARSVLHNCTVCFKFNAQAATQIMGNLPAVRLQPAKAFKHSGVDCAGPITIKQSTARNTITTKGYICLFICLVTKAVHIEAVTNMTTDAFIMAFKRFTARRGHCSDIYSDCGTNFVGANKELQRKLSASNRASAEQLANIGTEWHFIPPASPHFGGIWEAGIKSVKHHLRRVMQTRVLTFEELSTLLAEIESCLNSRPLCPRSSDPSDVNAITPANLIAGEESYCVPEETILDQNIDRLSRSQAVEYLKQHFWKRWSREYLSRMQARPKWLKVERDAQEGDLVLVLDERLQPGQWPLARVQQVHPGNDGRVRVVTLLSNGKLIKRPVAKIAFLPQTEACNQAK